MRSSRIKDRPLGDTEGPSDRMGEIATTLGRGYLLTIDRFSGAPTLTYLLSLVKSVPRRFCLGRSICKMSVSERRVSVGTTFALIRLV